MLSISPFCAPTAFAISIYRFSAPDAFTVLEFYRFSSPYWCDVLPFFYRFVAAFRLYHFTILPFLRPYLVCRFYHLRHTAAFSIYHFLRRSGGLPDFTALPFCPPTGFAVSPRLPFFSAHTYFCHPAMRQSINPSPIIESISEPIIDSPDVAINKSTNELTNGSIHMWANR